MNALQQIEQMNLEDSSLAGRRMLCPDRPGYEGCLQFVNNTKAKGLLYDLGSKIHNVPTNRLLIVPQGYTGMIDSSLIDVRYSCGSLEYLVLKSGSKSIERARRSAPPTVPYALSLDTYRYLEKVDDNDAQRVKRSTANFLRKVEIDNEGPAAAFPAFDREVRSTTNFVRNQIAELRGIDASDVALTLGAEECLLTVLRMLSNAGDKPRKRREVSMQLQPIEYSRFVSTALSHDVRLSPLKINYEDMMRSSVNRSDVTYISNPNNPLGTHLSLSELELLIGRTKRDGHVILDISGVQCDGPSSKEYVDMIKSIRRKIYLIDSLSKKEASPSFRVGWITANDNEIQEQFIEHQSGVHPIVGAALEKRFKFLRDNDVHTSIRNTLRDFNERLSGLFLSSNSPFRPIRPNESFIEDNQNCGGTYTMVEFNTKERASAYLTYLNHLINEVHQAEMDHPYQPTHLQINDHRSSRFVNAHNGRINEERVVRICGIGTDLQLEALKSVL